MAATSVKKRYVTVLLQLKLLIKLEVNEMCNFKYTFHGMTFLYHRGLYSKLYSKTVRRLMILCSGALSMKALFKA